MRVLALLTSLISFSCDGEPASIPEVPVAPPPAAVGPHGAWAADEDCGLNEGGLPVRIHYALHIEEDGVAKIQADGSQTGLVLDAHLRPEGDDYDLVLDRAEEGATFPAAVVPGAVLLRLHREGMAWQATPDALWFACEATLLLTPLL